MHRNHRKATPMTRMDADQRGCPIDATTVALSRRGLNFRRAGSTLSDGCVGGHIMSITLTPEQEAFGCVEAGRYHCVSDVVDAGLPLLRAQEQARRDFTATLEAAEAEGECDGFHDVDDVLAELDEIIDDAEANQARRTRVTRRHPSENCGQGNADDTITADERRYPTGSVPARRFHTVE